MIDVERGYKRHLVEYLRALPSNAHVLDIGCGTGKTMHLASRVRPDITVAGIDIEDTRESLPPGTDLKVGGVEDLTTLYKAESFDGVICQHVIEHLVVPTELITGIRHVLKSKGTVFLETPNWTRVFVPFSHLWFWNDYTHVHPYSKTAFARMFSEHGFDILDLITAPSCTWVRRGTRAQQIVPSDVSLRVQSARGIFSRVLARLVNPLVRDILIGIAAKR